MIFVRRKSDGKWHRGPGGNYGSRYGKETWLDDVNQCRPFFNERGARRAAGILQWKSAERRYTNTKEQDALFEFVPVKIQIEGVSK